MMFCHIVLYFCVNIFDCFKWPPLVNILKFQLSFTFFLCKFQLYLLFFFAFIVFNNWEKFAQKLWISFCSSSLNISFSLVFRYCLKKTAFRALSFWSQKLFMFLLAFRTSVSVLYRSCQGLVP